VAPKQPFGAGYQAEGLYDEMFAGPAQARPAYRRLLELLSGLGRDELGRRHDLALRMLRIPGITLAVSPDEQGIEKVFPFDVIPRVIAARSWKRLEAGLRQRMQALNLFLDDVYGRKMILRQRAISPAVVLSSPLYLREGDGLPAPRGLPCPRAGIDRVRDQRRAAFIATHFHRQPSDVYQYDLLLNSSFLGEEVCAELIAAAARAKLAALQSEQA